MATSRKEKSKEDCAGSKKGRSDGLPGRVELSKISQGKAWEGHRLYYYPGGEQRKKKKKNNSEQRSGGRRWGGEKRVDTEEDEKEKKNVLGGAEIFGKGKGGRDGESPKQMGLDIFSGGDAYKTEIKKRRSPPGLKNTRFQPRRKHNGKRGKGAGWQKTWEHEIDIFKKGWNAACSRGQWKTSP